MAIWPLETEVTSIRPPEIEPTKDADSGVMELFVVVATVGWAAFKADWMRSAAVVKLVALARLTDARNL
jgi:hypothetical protein